MAAIFFAALTLGMIGSFHCIGMCGPLAFSLPLGKNSDVAKFIGSFLYNMGRIITYSMLGLLFGLAGKSFFLFGFQQWLSIIAGLVILFFLMVPKKWIAGSAKNNWFSKYTLLVRTMIGQMFLKKNFQSLFAIGLLNGLLPCGLIYMAVAGAVVSADPFKSAFFMAAFGLGTLPVMWTVAFFGNYIGVGVRQKIRSVYPVMMALMACLLIVRGLGLGVPYVSPSVSYKVTGSVDCHPIVEKGDTKLK